jgi:hypothetical protein
MKIKTNVINVNLKEVLYENRHLKKKQEKRWLHFPASIKQITNPKISPDEW